MGYRFVPECNHAQESRTSQFFRFFFFCHICRPTVCSGPEILLPCMMRDVTTYLLYSPFFSTIISGPWWPLNGGSTVMLLLLLTYYTYRSRGDTPPPPPSFLLNFVASASLPLSDFSGSALELETFWSTIRWLNNGRKIENIRSREVSVKKSAITWWSTFIFSLAVNAVVRDTHTFERYFPRTNIYFLFSFLQSSYSSVYKADSSLACENTRHLARPPAD